MISLQACLSAFLFACLSVCLSPLPPSASLFTSIPHALAHTYLLQAFVWLLLGSCFAKSLRETFKIPGSYHDARRLCTRSVHGAREEGGREGGRETGRHPLTLSDSLSHTHTTTLTFSDSHSVPMIVVKFYVGALFFALLFIKEVCACVCMCVSVCARAHARACVCLLCVSSLPFSSSKWGSVSVSVSVSVSIGIASCTLTVCGRKMNAR